MSAPIVRFGSGTIADLAAVCAEFGVERPLLVTTKRAAAAVSAVSSDVVAGVFDGVESHVPVASAERAAARAVALGADAVIGLGGGSAVTTAKAVIVSYLDAGEPPPVLIAVPTTYAGAEWTTSCNVLLADGRKRARVDPALPARAAIYDPELTTTLPLSLTVATAFNALAHCAEAYYHPDTSDRAARHADTGAVAIAYALPLVVASPGGIYGRTRLLEGAMRAAFAIGATGTCLAHALAQAIGGRYGVSQGAVHALCLPAALRFNADAVPDAVARFAAALGTDDAPAACERLAALGDTRRLRDLGVPEADLDELAEAVLERPGIRFNPRPVDAAAVRRLLAETW